MLGGFCLESGSMVYVFVIRYSKFDLYRKIVASLKLNQLQPMSSRISFNVDIQCHCVRTLNTQRNASQPTLMKTCTC